MKDITKGNISKNFILYAIPVIISGVFGQAYLTIDKIMVGQVLGEAGLAALGSTGSFITLMKSIIWGLGTGVSLYIAFLSTGDDKRRMVNAIKLNLLTTSALAAFVSALAVGLYYPIFKMLAISGEIWDDAFTYYAIYMGGFVFFTFCNAASYIFNALGKPSFPMKLSLISSVANIVFNYILLVVFDLGVAGAAIGSVFVAAVISILYIARLYAEFRELGFGGEKIRFRKSDIYPAWRQGVPCMIQQFVMYVSGAAVQPAVNMLGTSAIAAYSVCSEIYSINATVFQNSSRGLSPFCAQCYGKGEFGLVKRGLRVSLRQGLVLSVPVMAAFMLFSENIAALFMKDASEESIRYVVMYILICVPFVICQVVNNLFHNFYRGIMMPKIATLTTVAYTLIRIATTYTLVWKLGMLGVFLGFAVPWTVECILSVVIYLSGKWKSEIYRNAERKVSGDGNAS